MNDRFKFRAYNKELRKMYEVDTICPYEDNHTKGGEVFLKGIQYNSFYFPEEVEVMQCTGFKDKNGKLIYEGDIVATYIKTLGGKTIIDMPEVVEYDENFCMFRTHYTILSKQTEVIGNIYENEDLLNENS